jgi:hypothetical protein
MQAIRGQAADVAEHGTLKPKQVAPRHLQTAPSSDTENKCPDAIGATDIVSSPKCANKRSPFRFKQPKAKVPKSPTDAGFVHSGGEVTPVYTVVHQGYQDLADAWSDPTVRFKTTA